MAVCILSNGGETRVVDVSMITGAELRLDEKQVLLFFGGREVPIGCVVEQLQHSS